MRFILGGLEPELFIGWKFAADLFLLAVVDIQLALR